MFYRREENIPIFFYYACIAIYIDDRVHIFFFCVFSFFRFRNKVSHSGKYLSPRTQYGTSML